MTERAAPSRGVCTFDGRRHLPIVVMRLAECIEIETSLGVSKLPSDHLRPDAAELQTAVLESVGHLGPWLDWPTRDIH